MRLGGRGRREKKKKGRGSIVRVKYKGTVMRTSPMA